MSTWDGTGIERRILSVHQLVSVVHSGPVAINVLEPGAFNPESQYFIPLFNKIS
jgi:hypothetical protein